MILKSAIDKLFKIREEASRVRPGADNGYDSYEKPFLDHLEDLRTTMIKMGATLAVITVLCFAFHIHIFQFLQLPAKITPMDEGGTLWDRINFIVLSPPEVLMLMIKVSFYTAVVLAMPLLIYFAFQFILPGLRQVEKKMVIPGAGVGFILFLIGVSFAFFLAAPIALKFFYVFENERIGDINPAAKALELPLTEMPLLGMNGVKIAPLSKDDPKTEPVAAAEDDPLSAEMKTAVRSYMMDLLAVQEGKNLVLRYDAQRDKIVLAHSKGSKTTYQIGKYFEFITRMTLVFGLSFQLPVVVTILVKLELLTARVMRSTRTYAWVIILVAAAFLTPPDPMTLAMLAGPMIILYEICVIIASILERKREKQELAEEEKRRTRLDLLQSKAPAELSEQEKAELHQHEIEQHELEHAHLYDPHPDDDDHPHWHDGEDEADEPIDNDDDRPQALLNSDPPDGQLVDVNRASPKELKTLPGVDDWMVDMIVDHRPYRTLERLGEMVGEQWLDEWEGQITVGNTDDIPGDDY